jgi:hypothetical protein
MYKLKVVSSPSNASLESDLFEVQNGENYLGRQAGNSIVLPSSKVSKRHCVLIASDGELVVRDQGSANGTFVNGVLTQSRRVGAGDRISLGDYVLQVVAAAPPMSLQLAHPAGGHPATGGAGGNLLAFPSGGSLPASGGSAGGVPGGLNDGLLASGQPAAPQDFKGKAAALFESVVMPFFFKLNLVNEWRLVCLMLVGAMCVGIVVLSTYPMIDASRRMVVAEAGRRALFMAKQIVDLNAPFLAQNQETKTDTFGIDRADGVRLAMLVDLDNRILAPASKLNQYLSSGPEGVLAVQARDAFRKSRETGFWREADSTTVVAVEPVKILNPQIGRNVTVGMAVVSIDTSISTLHFGEIGVIYSQAFILAALVAALGLLILYRLTLRPFEILNEDLDRVLKGDLQQVTHEFKLGELDALWDIINSLAQRASRNAATGGAAQGDQVALSAQDFEGPLRMIGSLEKFGVVVCDAEYRIVCLNAMFEEISGIRADSSIGQDFAAVARDSSFVPFMQDLASRCPAGGAGVSEDYDFSGITYRVSAASFGQAGGQPACVMYIFSRSEG